MKISNWWNKNMNEGMLNTFKGWVKDYNAESKKYVRDYIIKKGYKSIIDIGCGLCDTYYGYKNENYDIEYTGVDNCKYFISNAIKNKIKIINSDINDMSIIESNSYDVVYGRHILEHMPTFEMVMNEMIRIARKEIIIIFFIKPSTKQEIIYDETLDLYHNIYSRKEIEDTIKDFDFRWNDVNNDEIILFINK